MTDLLKTDLARTALRHLEDWNCSKSNEVPFSSIIQTALLLLTQRQLSVGLCGISESTVHRWRHEKNTPPKYVQALVVDKIKGLIIQEISPELGFPKLEANDRDREPDSLTRDADRGR